MRIHWNRFALLGVVAGSVCLLAPLGADSLIAGVCELLWDAPTAPTNLLAEGATNPTAVADGTPDLTATHHDPSGHPANKYWIQVSTDSSFASVSHWDSGSAGTPMPLTADNTAVSPPIAYGGSALTWGDTYYWRIKYWDTGGFEGAWDADSAFFTLELPSTTAGADENGDPATYGWRMLGFPIVEGTTIAGTELSDDLIGMFGYAVYRWNEATRAYVAMQPTDSLTGGVGYFVYAAPSRTIDVGNSSGNSSGTAAKGNQTISLSYTTLGSATGDEVYAEQFRGFTLVSNPFNLPVDWDNVVRTNCEPTYYVWDGFEYRWYMTGGDPLISVFDDFNDGDFGDGSPRTWTVDQGSYSVVSGELTDGSGTDDIIITDSSQATGTWEWVVDFSDLGATAQNDYRFYFMLDIDSIILDTRKGYMVRITSGDGYAATNRKIYLYRVDDSIETELGSTQWDPNLQAAGPRETFRVTRNGSGAMTVRHNGISMLSATDTNHTSSAWMWIRFLSASGSHTAATDVVRTGTAYTHKTDSGNWGATDGSIIPRFRAFWVRANSSASPSIEIPDPQTSSPSSPSAPPFDANWWRMRVKVESAAARDSANYAGVHYHASDTHDAFDVGDPGTMASPFVVGFFPHPEWAPDRPGDYAQDMRKTPFYQGSTVEWLFRVRCDTGQPVTVSFPNLASLPPNWSYEAEDTVTGTVYPLTPGAVIVYVPTGSPDERDFLIRTTRNDSAIGILEAVEDEPNADASVTPWSTGVPMIAARLTASVESIHVSKIRFQASGTGNEVTGIDGVWLLRDLNGNGTYEAGIDQLLGPLAYSADDGILEFPIGAELQMGQPETWKLLYDFGNDYNGVTFRAALDPATGIDATGAFTLLPSTITGAPMQSGEKTLIGGTGWGGGGRCGAAEAARRPPTAWVLVLVFFLFPGMYLARPLRLIRR